MCHIMMFPSMMDTYTMVVPAGCDRAEELLTPGDVISNGDLTVQGITQAFGVLSGNKYTMWLV